MEKLSELSKPVGFAREEDIKLMQSGKLLSGLTIWRSGKEPLYSQEYVSALLAELEAKDKRIANLEFERGGYGYSVIEDLNGKIKRIAELEARLATPVQLQNCDFESVAIMAHWCTDEQLKAWVKGVEHAKKQIRAAGFKVKGDE
ncbi:hypothetical protein [Serratia ureilytica]|uniref:hypothetical protein n=1 Tax=Serratia ureilytica TaxID=300181 RepID=UPI003F7DA53B